MSRLYGAVVQYSMYCLIHKLLRGACGFTKKDLISNESVYERFGMESKAEGIK